MEAARIPGAAPVLQRRRLRDRVGDVLLYGVTLLASLAAVALLLAIAWRVIRGSRLSFSTYGLSFLTSDVWDPVKDQYGALTLIFGTIVTSFVALVSGSTQAPLI